MGVIWHEALILATGSVGRAEVLRGCLIKIAEKMPDDNFSSSDWAGLISPVLEGVTNGDGFIFVAPDGSKEGWPTSDTGDEFRREVVKFARTSHVRVLAVRWGDFDATVTEDWEDQ